MFGDLQKPILPHPRSVEHMPTSNSNSVAVSVASPRRSVAFLRRMAAALARVLVILLSLEAGTGFATTFLQLDSTYLGDGWFQYRLRVMKDPFFSEAYVTKFAPSFTGQVDCQAGPQNWTNTFAAGASTWLPVERPLDRPNEQVFLMRSAAKSYQMGSFFLNLSLYPQAAICPLGDASKNIWYFGTFPCLVPGASEQEAGPSPTFSYVLKLLPDISIQRLLQTNGAVQGVDFTWAYSSTFLLQASTDLAHWTNVSYLWSSPPETLWMADSPLSPLGQFFRLELVANGLVTNLPPLSLGAMAAIPLGAKGQIPAPAATPRIVDCQVTQGRVAVSLMVEPNQACAVEALDSLHRVRAIRQVTASTNSATVFFEAQTLPSPVFFQVSSPDVTTFRR
jgi:hypothetical protein